MKTLFVKYNRDRLPYFQTVTKIVEDDTGVRKVIKEPLSAKATSHLKAIYSNYDLLISKYNIKLCKPTIIHNGIMFEMAQGESLEKLIVQYLDKQEKDRFITIVKKYLDYIDGFVSQRSVIFHPSTKFREIFGEWKSDGPEDIIDIANIDLIFGNLFIHNDELTQIDYEWVFDFPIPKSYVVWRAMYIFMYCYGKRYAEMNLSAIFDELIEYSSNSKCEVNEHFFNKYVFGDNCQYHLNHEALQKNKEVYKKIGTFHVQNMDLDIHEYIEFFIDTGKGFNAAQSKRWTFDAKQEKIVLSLNDYPHVCSIRFDPLNNFVKIRLKQVRVLCKNGEFYDVTDYQSNALFVEDSTFVFGTDDSQISFLLREDKEPEKIVIEVNYLLRGWDVFAELLAKCQMRMQTQDSELNVKKSELQAKDSELQTKELELQAKNSELHVKNSELQNKDSELHVKEGEIQQLREQLKQREGFIDLITHSRSWKVTKPLRMITELFHGGVKKSS